MIIFVSDNFIEQYVGGAELTTDAIMKDSLLPVAKLLSRNVNTREMEKYKEHFWVFGNFALVPEECLIYAAKNLNYGALEYDYKYCIYRSPEKHIKEHGECHCESSRGGKITSIFLNSAKALWWMSEGQMKHYHNKFSFLDNDRNIVLSSVFSRETIALLETLDTKNKNNKWIILNSPSWIKGADDSIRYAKENNLEYELVWALEYNSLLKKLANSKGLIFLPKGSDTCPRITIEAKLLECELILNENVQHKDESWFKTKETTIEYLRSRTSMFWSSVEDVSESLKISKKDRKSDIKYNIIVPFYNASNWIEKCIGSIKRQRYDNFDCFLIDDVSDDNSLDKAISAVGDDPRFNIVTNKEKQYALKNISVAIDTIKDPKGNDVIILLDGDDWLASSLVLSRLNEEYSNKECLVTYGSYVFHPWGTRGPEPSRYPESVIENNSFREDTWRASHLRTFRYNLWEHIDRQDFEDNNGKYYTMAYDQAIMLPLLEMSGERYRYIDDILHVYNKENPLNVDKIKALKQSETAKEIRQKRKYDRIK